MLVERVSFHVTILLSLHSLSCWCCWHGEVPGSGPGGDAALPPTFGVAPPPPHLPSRFGAALRLAGEAGSPPGRGSLRRRFPQAAARGPGAEGAELGEGEEGSLALQMRGRRDPGAREEGVWSKLEGQGRGSSACRVRCTCARALSQPRLLCHTGC